MTARTERGRAAEKRGRRAEILAALYLSCKLYRIVARRWRCPAGEIDLIAQSPFGVMCFVEVKTRQDEAQAVLSVHAAQRRRIMRAAEIFLRGHKNPKGARFDVVCAEGFRLRHIRDAWRPD